MTNDERQDVIKVLESLVGPCGNGYTDHRWKDCKRCQHLRAIEEKYKVHMKLLKLVIDELRTNNKASEASQ